MSQINTSKDKAQDTLTEILTRGEHELPVHPAAEMFPMMSNKGLVALGEGIKQTKRLQQPIVIYEDRDGKLWLLDGRNRLVAMARVGIPFHLHPNSKLYSGWEIVIDDEDLNIEFELAEFIGTAVVRNIDPYAYVIAANFHLRHLTVEQQHKIIADYVRRNPSKSDRQIGRELGRDHKTIAKVRTEQEDVGSIPHVETRADSRGRQQPAHKTSRSAPNSGRSRRFARQAAAVTGPQLADMWHQASPTERMRFFVQIGDKALAAHIPPSWGQTLAPSHASLPRPPMMSATPADAEDDPEVPAPRLH